MLMHPGMTGRLHIQHIVRMYKCVHAVGVHTVANIIESTTEETLLQGPNGLPSMMRASSFPLSDNFIIQNLHNHESIASRASADHLQHPILPVRLLGFNNSAS